MKVVESIEKIIVIYNDEYQGFTTIIEGITFKIIGPDEKMFICTENAKYKLEAVWQGCVAFIEEFPKGLINNIHLQ